MENLNTIFDFYNMVKKSWTYEKMTKSEQAIFDRLIRSEQIKEVIKGTSKQRYKTLNFIYSSFLAGLGYNGFNWREEKENIKF